MQQDLLADLLNPVEKPCSFCNTEYDDDDWGTFGWIGALPISLCPYCQSGLFDMVYQLTSLEELEEMVAERKDTPA